MDFRRIVDRQLVFSWVDCFFKDYFLKIIIKKCIKICTTQCNFLKNMYRTFYFKALFFLPFLSSTPFDRKKIKVKKQL